MHMHTHTHTCTCAHALTASSKVDDAATRVLMIRFYERLLGEAAGDAVLALQGAMV